MVVSMRALDTAWKSFRATPYLSSFGVNMSTSSMWQTFHCAVQKPTCARTSLNCWWTEEHGIQLVVVELGKFGDARKGAGKIARSRE